MQRSPKPSKSAITLEDIRAAHERIRGLAIETPLKPAYSLSQRLGLPVHLKLETTQPTGAFKIRGAANAVLCLPREVRQRGVITMSSGNHGQALAYVAASLGIPCVICVSEQVPETKIEGIRRRGAEVLVSGPDQNSATRRAHQLAAQRGLTYISPFDDPRVIAGQGTIALEVLQQAPQVDTLVVPVSGGGLIGGIALAARALRPEIRIYGVSQDLGPAMYESLRAGKIVEVHEEPSWADALQGGIPADNRYTFDLCRHHVDEITLLTETQIAEAMVYALVHERLVLEGGGASAIGALLKQTPALQLGEEVAIVLTGDNVDPRRLVKLTQDLEEG
ncbi:MAG: pyridoxal-phosphate dependent enzyme [Deltaproteobacteria bacterium]|nr:pyridoxal-phosphate dependent enzyme [Deltaproteobacteria bacterium]